jgi:hypothetical protein
LIDITVIADVDLAVGRLSPFDKSWVSEYAIFMDQAKIAEMRPGTSLCKLGYPFPELKPTFDEGANSFSLPPDTTIAFFPLDGMFTREIDVQQPNPPLAFPLRFIETSSPGLKGQSGGPTFDTTGVVWAIQSQTRYLPLDFSPEVKQQGQTHKEHQFLGVGMGIHAQTVIRTP